MFKFSTYISVSQCHVQFILYMQTPRIRHLKKNKTANSYFIWGFEELAEIKNVLIFLLLQTLVGISPLAVEQQELGFFLMLSHFKCFSGISYSLEASILSWGTCHTRVLQVLVRSSNLLLMIKQGDVHWFPFSFYKCIIYSCHIPLSLPCTLICFPEWDLSLGAGNYPESSESG